MTFAKTFLQISLGIFLLVLTVVVAAVGYDTYTENNSVIQQEPSYMENYCRAFPWHENCKQ